MPFLIFCSERAGCGDRDGDGVGAYGREEGAVDSAGDAALVGSVDALLRRSRCGCFAAEVSLWMLRGGCFAAEVSL